MDDIFKQLKKAQVVTMTDAERSAIRSTLMNVSAGGSTSAPQAAQVSPYASSMSMMGIFAKAAMFALVGFIVGGTSLTLASVKALPGDSLYAIKTNVTEKVAGAFAFSTEAKARAQADRVATRVTEIATVRQNGAINDSRVALETEASFNDTFASYTESLTKLRNEGRIARSNEIAVNTLTAIQTVAPARPTAKMIAPVSGMAAPAAKTAVMMSATMGIESQDTVQLTGLEASLSKAVDAIEALTAPAVTPSQEELTPAATNTEPTQVQESTKTTVEIPTPTPVQETIINDTTEIPTQEPEPAQPVTKIQTIRR